MCTLPGKEPSVGNRDSYTFGTCVCSTVVCVWVCASLVDWSLTLLLDDTVSDSLLALVLAWGTGCSPGVKVRIQISNKWCNQQSHDELDRLE